MLRIRASMLPSWPDCSLRALAKQWPEIVERATGVTPRTLLPSIGAAVGTAFHAAAAHVLTGEPGSDLEVARKALGEQINTGAEWDETTPTLQAADTQLERMLKVWRPFAAAHIGKPAQVEKELRADAGDGFELVGHLDARIFSGVIIDHKTGSRMPSAHAQFGAYTLLAEANGFPVTGNEMHYIKRCARTKPQDDPVVESYETDVTTGLAWSAIQSIKRDVITAVENDDISHVLPNPMSMTCTVKYCPLHSTPACKLWRSKDA